MEKKGKTGRAADGRAADGRAADTLSKRFVKVRLDRGLVSVYDLDGFKRGKRDTDDDARTKVDNTSPGGSARRVLFRFSLEVSVLRYEQGRRGLLRQGGGSMWETYKNKVKRGEGE